MKTTLVASLALGLALALPVTLPVVAANDCGDIAIFSRNSAHTIGANTNALVCVVGEVDAAPALINPGSDIVKVRYLTGTFDPGTSSLSVTLQGLGFEGESFLATRISFATGPDGYDTDSLPIPDGLTASGTLTATVYNLTVDGPVALGNVTYATADAAVDP